MIHLDTNFLIQRMLAALGRAKAKEIGAPGATRGSKYVATFAG
jgi:hypothetical protein